MTKAVCKGEGMADSSPAASLSQYMLAIMIIRSQGITISSIHDLKFLLTGVGVRNIFKTLTVFSGKTVTQS